jgi:hypothetical protein
MTIQRRRHHHSAADTANTTNNPTNTADPIVAWVPVYVGSANTVAFTVTNARAP